MIARYGAGNAGAAEVVRQRAQTPVTACPGNRRWVQLVFDSFLLMASARTAWSTPATRCWPPT